MLDLVYTSPTHGLPNTVHTKKFDLYVLIPLYLPVPQRCRGVNCYLHGFMLMRCHDGMARTGLIEIWPFLICTYRSSLVSVKCLHGSTELPSSSSDPPIHTLRALVSSVPFF